MRLWRWKDGGLDSIMMLLHDAPRSARATRFMLFCRQQKFEVTGLVIYTEFIDHASRLGVVAFLRLEDELLT